MKLVEPAQNKPPTQGVRKVLHQVRQLLPLGKPAEKPEDAIIARFQRSLDNRFVMLRDLQLEHLGPVFPPILVGPFGIAVLNMTRERGFFKAKEDTWWQMEKSSDRFSLGHPNLIKQTQDYASRLATALDVHGKPHPEVTPILVFTDPGVHIETINPAIRIVLVDGIDSLVTGWLNSEAVLHPQEVYSLSDSLAVIASPERAIPAGEGEDVFGQDLHVPEKKAPLKLPSIPLPRETPLRPVEEKLRFSKMQWFFLGVLLLLTILVLLVAILYALSLV